MLGYFDGGGHCDETIRPCDGPGTTLIELWLIVMEKFGIAMVQ